MTKLKIRRFKIPLTKTYIDTTLFKKSIVSVNDLFGVYCFTGKQGYGKTYSAVRWLHGWLANSNLKIYANIKSLKNLDYIYENNIDKLMANRDTNVVVFIDEIFKKIDPNDRRRVSEFTKWLGQSRKHNRIVIFTTQEWLDLPISLRRFCRRAISIQQLPFRIKVLLWGDAENMKYDEKEGEYICPVVSREFIRINKSIVSLYDTREAVE